MKAALVAFGLALLSACSSNGPVERREWTVMDTVAAVQWKGGGLSAEEAEALRSQVAAVFARVERLLDAHDPDSELSRLAALPDEEILMRCEPSVRPCYAAAFRLRDETGGLFNPRWRGAGTLDLGAIAKGHAADLAAEAVGRTAAKAAVLIDLGGNLKAVSGRWVTAVSLPDDMAAPEERPETFDLAAGNACATSGEYYRGAHIRDGRDGSAVSSGVVSVTVVHPTSAMLADGLSTVMFLLGRERGERFLRAHYPEARAIWR